MEDWDRVRGSGDATARLEARKKTGVQTDSGSQRAGTSLCLGTFAILIKTENGKASNGSAGLD